MRSIQGSALPVAAAAGGSTSEAAPGPASKTMASERGGEPMPVDATLACGLRRRTCPPARVRASERDVARIARLG